NRVIKNIEADGLKGAVRGMKRVTEVNPQITANLIELNVKNLIAAIAGAEQSDQINIGVEHVKTADGSEKEFPLDHGFTVDEGTIVENSEKIYLEDEDGEMVLQTRSKKYASRFIGDDRVNNKGFDTGLGTWALGGDKGTKEPVTDGQSGNCLKYTGAEDAPEEFLKLLEVGGTVLTSLVDGEHYRLQIAITKKDPGVWAAGDITVKCNAGEIIITPATAWVMYVIEFTASGTSADIKLSVSASPGIAASDVCYIDSLELEKVDEQTATGQVGYVMNWVEGLIYFATAPTEFYDVIASYTYIPKTASDAVDTTITGGEISDSDYIENVAIVGNVSGKNLPIICIIKNALADAGFSISTAPRDEAVPVIVFTGHYDPDDLDSEPWEIRYPKT
ncbi:unnamed protein product, partial [marine sediment metagenome]